MGPTTRGLLALAAMSVGYLLLVGLSPAESREGLTRVALTASMLGSAVLLGLAARRERENPRPWWLAAASAAAAGVTFAIRLGYELLGLPLPVPSVADVPYFASVTLLVLTALALQGPRDDRNERLRLTLDGAIVAGSLLVIAWSLVVRPAVTDRPTPPLGLAALLAYVVADVISLTIVVVLAARNPAGNRARVALVLVGIACLAGADAAHAFHTVTGEWHTGHPLSLLGFVGYPFIVVAARVQNGGAAVGEESTTLTKARVALLSLPVLGALVAAVATSEDRTSLAALAVVVSLVLVRQTETLFAELRLRAGLERRVAEQTEELRAQLVRDGVTGLGNRELLRQRAEHLAAGEHPTALLLLDLDGFKEVNDSYGHAAGDAVLVEIGSRLGSLTRLRDTVVRMGGDEFALLLPETGRSGAALIAERVLSLLREPLWVDGISADVRGSIGLAMSAPGRDVDEMLRQADLAMYDAKGAGGDTMREFSPEMHDRLAARLQIDADVRRALDAGEFTVYYQPIVAAGSGEVVGLEALVRWDHPERGMVPPLEFLTAAERTGVIVPLGHLVLRTACQQLAGWRQDWPELTVAVNLSESELLDPGLSRQVARALGASGLPGDALHLEITETVLATHDEIRAALDAVSATGVRLAIDDFGTGHSSLSRLRELPVDTLKIDKSFIAEIENGAAPLLTSIISLAHSLGQTVVAEGVETDAQLSFLAAQGCDYAQGYLISRPVPAESVVPLLFGARGGTGPAPQATPSALPDLVHMLVSGATDSVPAIRRLLVELSTISGLETVFLTRLEDGEQVTLLSHNGGSLTVPEGLSVPWPDTLCAQLMADGVRHVSDVGDRYPTHAAAVNLGIETYVTVPVRDEDGALVGTLCAASADRRPVEESAVALMELFAHMLAVRISELRTRV